jgi:ActR/RegA family two-component response regulator
LSVLTRIYTGSCIDGDIHYLWLEFYGYSLGSEDKIAKLVKREKEAQEKKHQKPISLSGIIWSKVQATPARQDEVNLMVNANQRLLQLSKQKTRRCYIHRVSNRRTP